MSPVLRDLQVQFLASVLHTSETIYAEIRADELTPADRLRIYRNNTYIGLAEILQHTYPIVSHLLAHLPFKRAAYTYIRQNPPRMGNMTEYGADFGCFLESFVLTSSYTFLKDIAHLEWLEQQSYYARDATPLDPKILLGLPEQTALHLTFRLLPSCQLLTSDHALNEVWSTFQASPHHVTLENIPLRKAYLVITRPHYKIFVHSISKTTFFFLTHLNQGKTLIEAYEAMPELTEGTDLQKILTELFRLQVLTNTHLNE